MTTSPATEFVPFRLPTGEPAWIPADVDLHVPDSAAVDRESLHFLTYIPWDDKYLALVPAEHRDFFRFVLPHLHARTTDVHVANCLSLARDIIDGYGQPLDERVVYTAFILHDSGWSQMSEQEIANSLGVAGLALNATAASPKIRHVELGMELARRLLAEYPFEPALTPQQVALILHAIQWHDRPQELAALPDAPPTSLVMCDIDHLWSFTYLNFWQDTARKGVDPRDYVRNLEQDLGDYLVTDAGRREARRMLAERRADVARWEEAVQPAPRA